MDPGQTCSRKRNKQPNVKHCTSFESTFFFFCAVLTEHSSKVWEKSAHFVIARGPRFPGMSRSGHSTATTSSALPAVEEDANRLEFGAEFNDVPCLLTSEVFVLLENQRLQKLSTISDSSQADRLFTNTFNKTFKYCQTFNRYKNKEMIREVRSCMGNDLCEYEMAQLANLCPESAEEAKVLVPSLARILDERLQEILDQLQNTRKFNF